MPFHSFQRLSIPEVILAEARCFRDDRGFFLESYKMSEFAAQGVPGPFVQDNWSHSCRGVLRGLHFQKSPKAQGKLVMVIQGEIYDVAVDLRAGSPSYLKWVGVTLSAEAFRMLWVPPGFAHGFCVMSEVADVVYKVTAEYAPDLDAGVAWNDAAIGVRWPISEPLLSPKDALLPSLRDADPGFVFG